MFVQNLVIIPSQIIRTFTIYKHIRDGYVFYIGCCKTTDLLISPDARENSVWLQFVQPGSIVQIEPISHHSTMIEAHQELSRLLSSMNPQPDCNRFGKPVRRGTTRIKNIDTGDIFENANQCAEHYQLSRGALSNHLNKRKGYDTVHGYRFERVE